MSTIVAAFTVLATVAFVLAFWRMKQTDPQTSTARPRARGHGDAADRGR